MLSSQMTPLVFLYFTLIYCETINYPEVDFVKENILTVRVIGRINESIISNFFLFL